MGNNLLYKASIVTTPTAYGVGVLNSIKPAQSFGEELIVNGSFSNGTTNWTANSSTLSVTNNSLKVLSTAGYGNAQQNITVVAGQTYLISANFIYGGSIEGRLNAYDGSATPTEVSSSSDANLSFYITISSGQTNLRLRLVNQSATTGIYNNWDNISVKQITDADFDFTRTSSATRVNPDYLIETVSINSANLVQNGNFSELGSELVTNGNFDTDSDWNLSSGAIISNGKLIVTNAAPNSSIGTQSNVVPAQKPCKLQLDIIVNSGSFRILLGSGGTSTQINTSGTYTFYETSGNFGTIFLQARAGGFDGSIDNVSVKQVDPNDNWTVSSGSSISQGFANIVSTGTYQYILQSAILIIGKKYKIQYTILSGSTGDLKLGTSFGVAPITSTVGTHSIIGTALTTDLYIERETVCDVNITDISVIEIQENGVPRLDYTNGTASILLEPQSTNLITYSEDLTSWTKVVSSVSYLDNVINPSGKTFTSKITQTSSGGYVQLSRTFTGVETFSAFVKKSSSDFVRFYAGGQSVYFNIINGTIETISGSVEDKSITDFGNGWFRISITVNSTSSSSVRIYPASSGSSTSGLNSIFVYGAQLETLSFATSYIPTTGSTVTRAAESLNNAGNSDLINSTEGVLYLDFASLNNSGNYRLISLSDGTTSNRLFIGFRLDTGYIYYFVIVAGSTQASNITTITATDFTKVAVKWKANDFALWVDGVEISSDTSGISFPADTLNTIQMNEGDGAGFEFYGKTKCLAVFSEALSDTELACLTSTNNREIFLNYYYRMQYVGANTEAVNCAQIKLNV